MAIQPTSPPLAAEGEFENCRATAGNGRALLDLREQLLRALFGGRLAAGARGVDEDFADLNARLAGLGLEALLVGLDLIVADDEPLAVSSAYPAAPADLGAQLISQGLGADALGGELRQQLVGLVLFERAMSASSSFTSASEAIRSNFCVLASRRSSCSSRRSSISERSASRWMSGRFCSVGWMPEVTISRRIRWTTS